MADRRPLLVLLALFAVIVGGTMAFGSPGDSGDDPSGDVPVVTTAAPVVPTSVAEAEWRAGLERVTALENEAFTNPNPRRVAEFMTTGCECYIRTVNTLSDMASKRYRKSAPNLTIVEAHFAGQPTANSVLVYVTLKANGKPTIDANGKVIEEGASGEFPPVIYNLVKGNDGVWRVASRGAPEERS